MPPLDALLAEFVPQIRSVDVVQARAVGGKEREQLVGAAGMRDVAVELLSIKLTAGSRALSLVARSRTAHRRTQPAVAVLRLPLAPAVAPVMVAPGIVGPIIAPIAQAVSYTHLTLPTSVTV